MSAIRKERTELLVGLFVFFGLAIMGALIVQFGRFSDRLRMKYRIEVSFPDASGIREGSPVQLAGQKIGFVAGEPTLNTDFTGVTVPIDIYGGKQIPIGSDFSIGTAGLMGDTFVKVSMPDEPEPVYLQEGARVEGGTKGGLEALQDDATVLLKDIDAAVADIRTAVQSLDRVFDKIENGMLADENIANLKTTFAEFKQTSENLNKASAKIEPLVDDLKGTVNEAKTAMTKAGETFDKAKETIGKADPAIEELQPTIAELRTTLEKAQTAIGKITDGGGATAALISDTGLRKDLESFIDKLDRYGILGYPKEKGGSGDSGSDSGGSTRSRPLPFRGR
ncbi:MAG: MCE family protein [Verrucomicrobiae bacterium]|nr:MCE family protein [Verrucomicrobiae bacterium]MCB1087620.1 MCE family protein [Verrucomicrobiae bacterium]